MSMPTNEEWAYAAGIIDGEGTICLGINTKDVMWLQVGVFMKGLPVCDWMHERFGGSLKDYPSQPGARTWRMDHAGQEAFLKGLLPYLVLKQREVAIALAFIETRQIPGRHITPETKAIRQRLYVLLQQQQAKWRAPVEHDLTFYVIDEHNVVAWEDVDPSTESTPT
jgi:hypothetical protein